jgi:hypothetical protein
VRRVYFTICATNYLPLARTCLKSVARVDPHATLRLSLCDRPAPETSGAPGLDESFDVRVAEDAGWPAFARNTLRYDVLELATSIKPRVFADLFAEGFDQVVYVDPDLWFVSHLDELDEAFAGGATAVLTPHACAPQSGDGQGGGGTDHRFLTVGAYNLGFLALANAPETRAFVRWWGERLDEDCVVDLERGLFTDQKWCDLLPCLVEGARVLRHDGYNVAYWNLETRELLEMPQGWRVNGRPLRFVHFSGARRGATAAVSTHEPNRPLQERAAFKVLADAYFAEVAASTHPTDPTGPCGYDVDARGRRVPGMVKRLHREAGSTPAVPAGQGPTALANMADAALLPDPAVRQDQDREISRLMTMVHRSRRDLREAFDLSTPGGRAGFVHWFEGARDRELGFAPEFAARPRRDAAPWARVMRQAVVLIRRAVRRIG